LEEEIKRMKNPLSSESVSQLIGRLEKDLDSNSMDLDWHYKRIKELERSSLDLKHTILELKGLNYGI
jgi:hypothetical protein